MLSMMKMFLLVLSILFASEQDCRIELPKINPSKVEKALTNGLEEVKEAIALREKIFARGHDFNKDPIPEFEAHLPRIIEFYTSAFKNDDKKLARFQEAINKIRAGFKKNKVGLVEWNNFHGVLNQIVDSQSGPFFGTAFFDNFICFIYREKGDVGVKAKNLADASGIWLLPMVGSSKVRLKANRLRAGEFTNSYYHFTNPFQNQSTDTLLAIYDNIEKLEDLEHRARAHLALYTLLRESRFRLFDYFEQGSIKEVLNTLRDPIALNLQKAGDKITPIYGALRFEGAEADIVIRAVNSNQFSVSGETEGGVAYHFLATLEPGTEGDFHLKYTDENGLIHDAIFEINGINSYVDKQALRIAKALNMDTSSDTFPIELIQLVDEFITNQETPS